MRHPAMLGGAPQIIKINASSSYAGKGMKFIFMPPFRISEHNYGKRYAV